MRIAYLVHDLHDAAVARRIALLQAQGGDVRVAGFRRRDAIPAAVAGAPAVDLGRTRDGRLVARILSVVRHCLLPRRLRAVSGDADVLLARNLEALVLAARARRPGQRLVYECLDIHRLLLGDRWASRLLHAVERWAMQHLDLLIVSAPAFLDDYFIARRHYAGPALLVENKVPGEAAPAANEPPPLPVQRPPLPVQRPWVIGWFGMLRCRRTLAMLGQIVAQSGGAVEVLIAGVPSAAEFGDFAGSVAAYPGLRYCGPYKPADLPGLFAQVHFIWAIDFFEEGLNSAWLLPNRLYEGITFGAVPLALAGVETGRWLKRNDAGVLLDDPMGELPGFLQGLTAGRYAQLRDDVAAIPAASVRMLPQEAHAVAAAIMGPARSGEKIADQAGQSDQVGRRPIMGVAA